MTETPHDQRVFIGGIAGGVGSALANHLSSANATVGGFGRASDKWESFRESHPELDLYEADSTDPEAVGAAVKAFVDTHGGIDAYVHAVGSVLLKPLHMTRDADWAGALGTNLTSAFIAARAVIEPMRRKRHGALVFFSSVAAGAGLANHEAIAAAKGGVEGLVRAIAATYASVGIRANAIAPGLVETPATAAIVANEQARQVSERMHPLGRIGRPRDIAGLAAWLISPQAEWMTGQVIGMDGGLGAIIPRPRA
jgi:NAD(P)-dependent dehydrogenase (short-subunit alcohol dehydrogenase family)